MAAIDFPASPTNGQVFNASNGVTYVWNSTLTLWRALGVGASIYVGLTAPPNPTPGMLWYFNDGTPGGGQTLIFYDDGNTQQWVPTFGTNTPPSISAAGDFCVAMSATGVAASAATIIWPASALFSGNSGGWYNYSNGRFTPPAGRYHIYAQFNAGVTSGATQITLFIRKNGVVLYFAGQTPGSANWFGDPTIALTLDANGTDWFDIQAACNNGSNVNQWMSFGAFAIGQVVNLVPDGIRRLYAETRLAANNIELIVPCPAGAKSVELEYEMATAGGTDDILTLQVMAGGSPVAGTAYTGQYVYGVTNTPGASLNAGTSYWSIGSGTNWFGFVKGTLAPAFQASIVFLDGMINTRGTSSRGVNGVNLDCATTKANVNGFRFTAANNIVAGSVARVYVVT